MLIGCVLAALVVGCASTESVQSAPPATKTVAKEETKQVKLDKSNMAEAQAAGYKIVDKNGTKLYCRKELETGSHVRYRTSCLTQEEWAELAQTSRDNVQGMARRIPPPQGK